MCKDMSIPIICTRYPPAPLGATRLCDISPLPLVLLALSLLACLVCCYLVLLVVTLYLLLLSCSSPPCSPSPGTPNARACLPPPLRSPGGGRNTRRQRTKPTSTSKTLGEINVLDNKRATSTHETNLDTSKPNFCLKMPQDAPGETHIGSNLAPRCPKMTPRWPKMAPRSRQDGPKLSQDVATKAYDSLKNYKKNNGKSRFRLLDCILASRWPKMAPRWPRVASRWPKQAARWPQDGPGWLQDAPRRPQDGPKMAQSGPKMSPRRLKAASKIIKTMETPLTNPYFGSWTASWPQDGLKWPQYGPKWAQDGPTMAQYCNLSEKLAPRSPNQPQTSKQHHQQ